MSVDGYMCEPEPHRNHTELSARQRFEANVHIFESEIIELCTRKHTQMVDLCNGLCIQRWVGVTFANVLWFVFCVYSGQMSDSIIMYDRAIRGLCWRLERLSVFCMHYFRNVIITPISRPIFACSCMCSEQIFVMWNVVQFLRCRIISMIVCIDFYARLYLWIWWRSEQRKTDNRTAIWLMIRRCVLWWFRCK